jgi:hypothetical protein
MWTLYTCRFQSLQSHILNISIILIECPEKDLVKSTRNRRADMRNLMKVEEVTGLRKARSWSKEVISSYPNGKRPDTYIQT